MIKDKQKWDGKEWVKIPYFNKTQLYKKVPEFIKHIKKDAKIGRDEHWGTTVKFRYDTDKAEKAIKEFIKFLRE